MYHILLLATRLPPRSLPGWKAASPCLPPAKRLPISVLARIPTIAAGLFLESPRPPNGRFTLPIPSHFEPLFRFGAAPLDADPFVWISKERNASCKN
jgi:hypothetical protein